MKEKFLLIHPDASLEVIDAGSDHLAALQQAVGGLIDVVSLAPPASAGDAYCLDFYVNDEGKMNGMAPNFPASFLFAVLDEASCQPNLFFGEVVLAAGDSSTGESHGLTDEFISSLCQMFRINNPITKETV